MKRILLIVVFVFALTACSSTNKAALDGPHTATLNVKASSQGYDSSTYVVPAGADVTVNFTNDSPLPHELAILKQGEHVTAPFQPKDDAKIMWKLISPSGVTRSEVFQAPAEPGEYD